VSATYLKCQFLISAITLGSSSYLFGARGIMWLIILIVGYFPVDVVVASMMRLYAPPRLHLSEQGYRPQLRSNSDQNRGEVIEAHVDSAETVEHE
jgi:hypothetical protein